MDCGWICLYRKLREHHLWQEKPFTKGQAWVDILLRASHKEHKVHLEGRYPVLVPRGGVLTSTLKLAKEWGWSRGKVRNFLALLEKESQISHQKSQHYSMLLIHNYGQYQDFSESEKPTEKPTPSQQEANRKPQSTMGTIKQGEQEDSPRPRKTGPTESFSSADMDTAKWMLGLIKIVIPGAKDPNFNSWAKEIGLIRRMDKRPDQEIRDLFLWANNDPFWKSIILSPGNLRRKWNQLSAKSIHGSSGTTERAGKDDYV